MQTKIYWQLTSYCTAGCSYCPSKFWNGEKHKEISEYVSATKILIDHYNRMGRSIKWSFSGGELLEIFDFPELLKLCKQSGGEIEIETNGGKLWLDWWAIEPHVDTLHLTYHYWQNPNLIRFIIQAFKGKNKQFNITVPIRPTHFDEDMLRASDLEQTYELSVHRQVLYDQADSAIGLMKYTETQLEQLMGVEWVNQHIRTKPNATYADRIEERVNTSPVYTGYLCNVGIEYIRISPEGWVSGSNCNNAHLGNLWVGLNLPTDPQPCKMQACVDGGDQQITKFMIPISQ